MNNEKSFLPIGTVVLLKGAKKRVMITGFCCTDQMNTKKMYDYTGCAFPEGVIAYNRNLLFNNEQIEKVFFVGYSDPEEKEYKSKLNDLLKKIKQSRIDNKQ